jgi:hypothetical protein
VGLARTYLLNQSIGGFHARLAAGLFYRSGGMSQLVPRKQAG